ncbi:acyl carrier protein [Aureimonas psammosilenae]|uniref:acyl carrier protein n=1 Tax=Aureimonas psammosilenae TaxID=2495496 RepID=UPI001F2D7C07|nr:acyl carrier protein [Aureimonas psammosilenae]
MDHSLSTTSSVLLGEITQVLQSMLGRPVFLEPETNIVADLGLDSLALMDFCMELEDRLDISIPLHQMADVVSVGDLASAISGLRK